MPFSTLFARRVAGKTLSPLGGSSHIAAARDEHTDDQFRHSVGVGTGSVEHHDALLTAPVERNIVDTGTGTGNGQQVVIEGGVQQVGAADKDAVGGVGVHRDIEQVFVQLCQTYRV